MRSEAAGLVKCREMGRDCFSGSQFLDCMDPFLSLCSEAGEEMVGGLWYQEPQKVAKGNQVTDR